MKNVAVIFYSMLGLSLSACGTESSSLDEHLNFNLNEDTKATAALYCPEGYSLSASSALCLNNKEALGPFTSEMIARCRTSGGGAACDNQKWSASLASGIRGTNAACMPGAQLDSEGLCVEGENAFGPFPKELVEKCQTSGGGPACSTMRWSRNFARSLWMTLNPNPNELKGMTVALDIGHGAFAESGGGWEPGAINPIYKSLTEYGQNLKTGSLLKQSLLALGATVSMYSYPQGAKPLTLSQRGAKAKGHRIFLSLQHNSFNRSTQGTEVFVLPGRSTGDTKLANLIQKALVKRLWNGNRNFDRGVKSANFGVLRGVPGTVESSVLIEAYFLDEKSINPKRADELTQLSALAITDSLKEFWKAKQKLLVTDL